MSNINAINGVSSLWSNASTVSASSSASDTLSQMVSNMSGAGGGSQNGSEDETETSTKIMADGSVMVIVTKGEEIISQTKISSGKGSDSSAVVSQSDSTRSTMDKFNDSSSSILTGSLFNAGI